MAGLVNPTRRPLHVSIEVYVTKPRTSKLPFPKPDVDNYAKSILDVANGILWEDDWQIQTLNIDKHWTEGPGYVDYTIEEISK